MRLEEAVAKRYAGAFLALHVNPLRLTKAETFRDKVGKMGLSLTPFECASFALGNSLIVFLVFALICSFMMLDYALPATYAAILCVGASASAFFGTLQYFDLLVVGRAKDVDSNILASSRYMLATIKSGVPLYDAIAAVGNGGFGAVSELFSEAVILIREGEDVDAAFRSVGATTTSAAFRRFVAAISQALNHGTKIDVVLSDFARQMEMRQRHEVSVFASEAMKLGLFSVILTGIVPGMIVFMVSQMEMVGGVAVSISILPLVYAGFLLFKYVMFMRLAGAAPGVG